MDKELNDLIGAAQAAVIALGSMDSELARQAKEALRAAVEKIERRQADAKINERWG